MVRLIWMVFWPPATAALTAVSFHVSTSLGAAGCAWVSSSAPRPGNPPGRGAQRRQRPWRRGRICASWGTGAALMGSSFLSEVEARHGDLPSRHIRPLLCHNAPRRAAWHTQRLFPSHWTAWARGPSSPCWPDHACHLVMRGSRSSRQAGISMARAHACKAERFLGRDAWRGATNSTLEYVQPALGEPSWVKAPWVRRK